MELSARPFLCRWKMNCPVDNNVFHPLLQVQLARTLTNAKQRFERLERPLAGKRFESCILQRVLLSRNTLLNQLITACLTPSNCLWPRCLIREASDVQYH
ncbi:hypothetical protein IFM89_010615 [Coptis chinensis]|uniref:Uncharacterized protein n=1 Tax=Coptis chinensis TaxID=261450 RepID=A0A835IMJ5_9MAGN|nr:hypothetical protein IFM89_010615 [Coptis chinensis]